MPKVNYLLTERRKGTLDLHNSIKRNIGAALTIKSWHKKDLAKEADTYGNRVTNILKDPGKMTLEEIDRFSKACGMSVLEFLGGKNT